MEIIPAIDIMGGKCVRLEKGDFTKKIIYYEDPLEAAKMFEAAGIRRLHIVDLDGAGGGSLQNLKSLERISTHTGLVIDFGGGLKNTEDLLKVFNAGASMISLGSLIFKNPPLFSEWLKEFGPDKFLPGADVLEKKVRIHGWKSETGTGVFDFINEMVSKGVGTLFCTDISRDGMLQGPAVDLYREIMTQFPSLGLIASGGISGVKDLELLQEVGCQGAIVGKALYEGKIGLEEIKEYLKST